MFFLNIENTAYYHSFKDFLDNDTDYIINDYHKAEYTFILFCVYFII